MTIAMSILIRWANNFAPLGPKLKSSLSSFSRFQKKHLMFLHYYLNPVILGIALALAHVHVHILGPPGNGSGYDGDSHESWDCIKIQVMPHKPSKTRLSNPYSPGFLLGHNFGAGNWPYDCGLTFLRTEFLMEQGSKCRPLLSHKIHMELLICPDR